MQDSAGLRLLLLSLQSGLLDNQIGFVVACDDKLCVFFSFFGGVCQLGDVVHQLNILLVQCP